jgi:TPR repeat protein
LSHYSPTFFNLALLYYSGVGTPRDIRYAIYWFTKAAEQGHALAQYKLGRLYMYGYGEEVQEGSKWAVYWLTKASEQGNFFAKEDRDKMLERMSQSQIEEVQKLSKEFYEKIYNKAK